MLYRNSLSLILSLLICPSLWAQSKDPALRELSIDLAEFCLEEELKEQNKTPETCVVQKPTAVKDLTDNYQALIPFLLAPSKVEERKKQTCESVKKLSELNANPIEMKLKDDQGNPWKIRFHFGFTRTNIRPTDVTIKSSRVNTVIKGFEFSERTSAQHYDPRTWEHLQDAARWIDEPSNTFTLSIENKKNAFYITAFHPKFLKTYYEIKDDKGVRYEPATEHLSNGTPVSYGAIPDGQAGVEIQNTHLLMNYQIGYGRKFTIFDSPKSGKLVYAPHVDAGVTIGGARSIYIVKNESWEEHRDPMGLQGLNATAGHRLEYQIGKVAMFVDQKYTKAQMDHSFLDGTASYKLDYSTVTFGVVVDVFTPKTACKTCKETK